MIFISSFFIIFFITFLLLYFTLPKRIQPYILGLFSVVFLLYNNFNIYTIFEVLLILITSYIGGILIEKNKKTKKSLIYTIISVLIILMELIILKYSNLFIVTFNYIFNYKVPLVNYISPTGISYFALMMISYLIDVYRNTINSEKNIFKLLNFMSYFPILVSGPFIRYDEYGSVINKEHKFETKRFMNGLVRIIYGLFKVIVISNQLNIIVNSVYNSLHLYNGLFIFATSLIYTFELYTNFSGCIDIVLGISHIIGIDLSENFDNPFSSKSISEFWRKWHITLGSWLKDYVFYPLLKSNIIQKLMGICTKTFGKKKGKKIPTYLAMFILWLTIGIWHGGNYKFILASGIIQFIYILFEEILKPLKDKLNKLLHINDKSKVYNVLQMIKTYILFALSMVFFKADNVSHGIKILKSMLKYNTNNIYDLNIVVLITLIISILLVFIYDFNKEKINNKIKNSKFEIKLIIILIFVLTILLFGTYGLGFNHNEFIYGNF